MISTFFQVFFSVRKKKSSVLYFYSVGPFFPKNENCSHWRTKPSDVTANIRNSRPVGCAARGCWLCRFVAEAIFVVMMACNIYLFILRPNQFYRNLQQGALFSRTCSDVTGSNRYSCPCRASKQTRCGLCFAQWVVGCVGFLTERRVESIILYR